MIPRSRLLLIALVCLALGVLILTWGCAPMACRTKQVPVTFLDGSMTTWPITICERRW